MNRRPLGGLGEETAVSSHTWTTGRAVAEATTTVAEADDDDNHSNTDSDAANEPLLQQSPPMGYLRSPSRKAASVMDVSSRSHNSYSNPAAFSSPNTKPPLPNITGSSSRTLNLSALQAKVPFRFLSRGDASVTSLASIPNLDGNDTDSPVASETNKTTTTTATSTPTSTTTTTTTISTAEPSVSNGTKLSPLPVPSSPRKNKSLRDLTMGLLHSDHLKLPYKVRLGRSSDSNNSISDLLGKIHEVTKDRKKSRSRKKGNTATTSTTATTTAAADSYNNKNAATAATTSSISNGYGYDESWGEESLSEGALQEDLANIFYSMGNSASFIPYNAPHMLNQCDASTLWVHSPATPKPHLELNVRRRLPIPSSSSTTATNPATTTTSTPSIPNEDLMVHPAPRQPKQQPRHHHHHPVPTSNGANSNESSSNQPSSNTDSDEGYDVPTSLISETKYSVVRESTRDDYDEIEDDDHHDSNGNCATTTLALDRRRLMLTEGRKGSGLAVTGSQTNTTDQGHDAILRKMGSSRRLHAARTRRHRRAARAAGHNNNNNTSSSCTLTTTTTAAATANDDDNNSNDNNIINSE